MVPDIMARSGISFTENHDEFNRMNNDGKIYCVKILFARKILLSPDMRKEIL
jgi:hypothetical protein